MKNSYSTPRAEKIEFNYQNQVIASSNCFSQVENYNVTYVCVSDDDDKTVTLRGNKS